MYCIHELFIYNFKSILINGALILLFFIRINVLDLDVTFDILVYECIKDNKDKQYIYILYGSHTRIF
jgi:hypothetical protein